MHTCLCVFRIEAKQIGNHTIWADFAMFPSSTFYDPRSRPIDQRGDSRPLQWFLLAQHTPKMHVSEHSRSPVQKCPNR